MLRSVTILSAHIGAHGRALLTIAAWSLPSICRLPRGKGVSGPASYQSLSRASSARRFGSSVPG